MEEEEAPPGVHDSVVMGDVNIVGGTDSSNQPLLGFALTCCDGVGGAKDGPLDLLNPSYADITHWVQEVISCQRGELRSISLSVPPEDHEHWLSDRRMIMYSIDWLDSPPQYELLKQDKQEYGVESVVYTADVGNLSPSFVVSLFRLFAETDESLETAVEWKRFTRRRLHELARLRRESENG